VNKKYILKENVRIQSIMSAAYRSAVGDTVETNKTTVQKQRWSPFQNIAKNPKPGDVILKFTDYEPLPQEVPFLVSHNVLQPKRKIPNWIFPDLFLLFL